MLDQLTQLLQAKWLKHNNEDYSYYSIDEIQTPSDDDDAYLATVTHLSVVKISGNDAESFLQGQLTIDVAKPTEAPIGLYCSRKGRVISLFYFIKSNNDFYLILPKSLINTVIKQLKLYVIAAKVTIELLDSLVIATNTDLFDSLEINLSRAMPTVKYLTNSISFIEPSDINLLSETLAKKTPLNLIGDWGWHKKQILLNIPRIYPDTLVKYLPHDLGLHKINTIAFDKGCFIGQEIIARMHYKAKLKYDLCVSSDINSAQRIGENDIVDKLNFADNKTLSLILKKAA